MDGAQCGLRFFHVGECLEAEPVHAAREQSFDLASERRFRFVATKRAERFEPRAERTDCAEDRAVGADCTSRQARRRGVEQFHVVGETVLCQLERIGAERVGLDQLGAGVGVCGVNLAHHVGCLHDEFVETGVEKDPLVVEHRSHRAIDDVDASISQEIAECWHRYFLAYPSTGESQRSAVAMSQPFRLA